jgi:3-oxoacyl-[acyl-carrier protein] reductase
LVTGADSGIGKAVAMAMADAGAAIAVTYVFGEEDARAVVDGTGGRALATRADVRDPDRNALRIAADKQEVSR